LDEMGLKEAVLRHFAKWNFDPFKLAQILPDGPWRFEGGKDRESFIVCQFVNQSVSLRGALLSVIVCEDGPTLVDIWIPFLVDGATDRAIHLLNILRGGGINVDLLITSPAYQDPVKILLVSPGLVKLDSSDPEKIVRGLKDNLLLGVPDSRIFSMRAHLLTIANGNGVILESLEKHMFGRSIQGSRPWIAEAVILRMYKKAADDGKLDLLNRDDARMEFAKSALGLPHDQGDSALSVPVKTTDAVDDPMSRAPKIPKLVHSKSLYIGKTFSGEDVFMSLDRLRMHLLVTGTKRVGKTTLEQAVVEELRRVKPDVPILVISPDNAFTSMINGNSNKAELAKYKEFDMDAKSAHGFGDVFIYTPGADYGIPLSVNLSEVDSEDIRKLLKLGSDEASNIIFETIVWAQTSKKDLNDFSTLKNKIIEYAMLKPDLCRDGEPKSIVYKAVRRLESMISGGLPKIVGSNFDAAALLRPGVHVLALKHLNPDEKLTVVGWVIKKIRDHYWAMQETDVLKYFIVFDEGQEFHPERVSNIVQNRVCEISERGSKRGVGMMTSTLRISDVKKRVLQDPVVFQFKVLNPADLDTAGRWITLSKEEQEALAKLQVPGNAVGTCVCGNYAVNGHFWMCVRPTLSSRSELTEKEIAEYTSRLDGRGTEAPPASVPSETEGTQIQQKILVAVLGGAKTLDDIVKATGLSKSKVYWYAAQAENRRNLVKEGWLKKKSDGSYQPSTKLRAYGTTVKMNWRTVSDREFEEFVAKLFRKIGYQSVELTPVTADKGVDVIASRKDGLGQTLKYAVQCKRYINTKVGSDTVRDFGSALQLVRADFGVIVTSSGFTKDALETARTLGKIMLWDGNMLEQKLSENGMLLKNRDIPVAEEAES